jgi:hypothetical protein
MGLPILGLKKPTYLGVYTIHEQAIPKQIDSQQQQIKASF